MKKYIFCLCSIWLLTFLYGCFPDKNARVVFCDVGQGDAVLIQHGFTQLLIDTGKDTKVIKCLEKNMPKMDRTIEFLLLTHMDSDHIGGATGVLGRFFVGTIFMNPSAKKTDDFAVLQQALLSKISQKMQLVSLFAQDQKKLTSLVSFSVMSPRVEQYQDVSLLPRNSETTLSDVEAFFSQKIQLSESENDLSIGVILDIGNICFVLTGDMEEKSEIAVVAHGMTRDCDVLKAGHHGSKSSSAPLFVEQFKPEIVVISSGVNNAYKHPSPQVVDYFNQKKIPMFRTDTSGDITFVSNGTAYWLQ